MESERTAKRYNVKAVWDSEAGVYYAKSNIPGLNVEAATVAEFIEIVKDLAPDLIASNEPEHARAPCAWRRISIWPTPEVLAKDFYEGDRRAAAGGGLRVSPSWQGQSRNLVHPEVRTHLRRAADVTHFS
jgi:hypothetical protein